MIWLTADWHLGHENIIKYCNRPFHGAGEMNSALLANALEVVGDTDTLYVLGDFAYAPDTFRAYAAALESACTVFWVKGNHDGRSIRSPLMLDFKHNKHHYYCLHYPLLSWRPNTICVHGHSHGNPLSLPEDSRLQWRYDVGCDVNWFGRKYRPVSTDQIEEAMRLGIHPTR